MKIIVDKSLRFWYTNQALEKSARLRKKAHGEVSERFKEPVLKTGDTERYRGFESHLLRLTNYIESWFS